MPKLRAEAARLAAAFSAMSLCFFAGIGWALNDPSFLWGLPLAAAILAYEIALLWRGLPLNHRLGETDLLPTLGAGTLLTMLRGLLLAWLGGFAVLPRPVGWLAWIPGALYLLAAVADYLDGYAARVTNHTTRLGQRVDMDLDALGILIAPTVAVVYGQLPVWYLLVSAARYAFVFGELALARRGEPLADLPPSHARRFMAGFQMGLCAAVLLPLFTPPGTHIVATLFMIPFLSGFLRDWLIASRQLDPASSTYRAALARLETLFTRWLPIALRLGLPALWIAGQIAGAGPQKSPAQWIVEALALIAAAAGLVGRLAALVFLVALAGPVHGLPVLDGFTAAQVVAAAALMLTGSGLFAAWSPDELFLRTHIGVKSGAHG